jgi:hypothetical protein
MNHAEIGNELREFLNGFRELMERYYDNAAKFLSEDGQGESARMIPVYKNATSEAITRMSEELFNTYNGLSSDEKQPFDRLFRMSGGPSLVQNGLRVLREQPASSASGLGSYGEIVEIIKKIIKLLVEIFSPTGVPPWLEKILVIIDNILRIVLNIYAPGAALALHRFEINEYERRLAARRLELLEIEHRERLRTL